jgi:hypothetical protein
MMYLKVETTKFVMTAGGAGTMICHLKNLAKISQPPSPVLTSSAGNQIVPTFVLAHNAKPLPRVTMPTS